MTNSTLLPKVIYHYCSVSAFKAIVESSTLWATHCRCLNDSTEFEEGARCLDEVLREQEAQAEQLGEETLMRKFVRRFRLMREEAKESTYVASLTRRGDMLSQWRGYADDGAGFSVGFEREGFPVYVERRADKTVTWSGQCSYDRDTFKGSVLKQVGSVLDEMRENGGEFSKRIEQRMRGVLAKMCTLKHSAFAEEEEWRFVAIVDTASPAVRFRPGPRGLIPYIELDVLDVSGVLPICEVYVGPTQSQEFAVHATKRFLGLHGYRTTEVKHSAAPYRT